MLAAILLAAGVCASPPLFDDTGPGCLIVRQAVECACTECFTWDSVEGATHYEILRRNQDGTSGWIGNAAVHEAYTDDDGVDHPLDPVELWCVAKDVRTPIDGRRYVYEVRACSGSACGPWSGSVGSGSTVTYIGAPYRCYDHEAGGQVVCPHS
jgi:hypothetical protein